MQHEVVEGIFTFQELFTEGEVQKRKLGPKTWKMTISGDPIFFFGGGHLLEGGVYRGFYGIHILERYLYAIGKWENIKLGRRHTGILESVMCDSRHLESGSKSRYLKSVPR